MITSVYSNKWLVSIAYPLYKRHSFCRS